MTSLVHFLQYQLHLSEITDTKNNDRSDYWCITKREIHSMYLSLASSKCFSLSRIILYAICTYLHANLILTCTVPDIIKFTYILSLYFHSITVYFMSKYTVLRMYYTVLCIIKFTYYHCTSIVLQCTL